MNTIQTSLTDAGHSIPSLQNPCHSYNNTPATMVYRQTHIFRPKRAKQKLK